MPTVVCPVLIGREAQMASLEGALVDHAGGLVLVVGDAGMGKSRLVREARVRALAQGRQVVFGRATDQGESLPFRPLAEALAGLQVLPPFDGPELAPFAEVIRRVVPHWGGNDPIHSQVRLELLTIGEAVVRLLMTVSGRQGTLIILEDLHWADPETLDLLDYLGDHLGRTRAVCVATMRTGDGHGIEGVARRIGSRHSARLIELGPLSSNEVDIMMAECLDSAEAPDDLLRLVRSQAEGVPLVVEELLSSLEGDGALFRPQPAWQTRAEAAPRVPATFAASITRRLAALPDADRLTVEAAAVLGRRFDWTLLAGATGLTERQVIEGLRGALTAQVLVEESDAFAFRHALSRDAVLAQMMIPRRKRLAAGCLDAIEYAHPGLPGAWCTLAARVAEEAVQLHRAGGLLVEVARRAIAGGAPASARASLDRARPLARDDLVLLGRIDEAAAQAAALAGEVDLALELGRSVLAAPVEVLDQSRRAGLSLVLARAALQAGRWGAATASAGDAGRFGENAADPPMVAAALAVAAQAAMGDGRFADAVNLAARSCALGRDADAPASVCEALEVLGREARLRDLAEAEGWFEEARLVAERHSLGMWRARALHELGTIDLFTTLRRDRLDEARDAAAEAGAVATVALVDLHIAAISLARFEPEDAIAAAERSADLSRRLGLATMPMSLVHLAAGWAMAGHVDRMEAVAAEALAVAPADPEVRAGIPGRVRALLHLRRGEWGLARGSLDEAVLVLREHPTVWFPFWGLWALLHAIEDNDAASAFEEAERRPGRDIGLNLWAFPAARAVAAGRRGDGVGAVAFLASADELVTGPQQVPVWSSLQHLMVASAAVADGWGDPVAWTRRSLRVFEDHGLAELAGRSRALLREVGEPVPRHRRGAGEVPPELVAVGVTGREADVLRLVAAGLSNKAIGGRLHLSHRTVERHVANLLAKTDTEDRRDLAALAARKGLA